MFGYVNICKDELRIKDYNTYKAYYCGLCKRLGKRHNQLTRLSLNYDFAFLALLADSICDAPTEFKMQGCIKKTGKRKTVTNSNCLDFASDMNILLSYHKLRDDIYDDKSLKAAVAIIPFLLRVNFLKRKYDGLSREITVSLARLKFLEETKCDILDKAAHEFAVILEQMFGYVDISLKRFGYLLGRIIYIMDACDDIRDDYKNGRYNAAVLQYGYIGTMDEKIKSAMRNTLYYSLSELAGEYQKIEIKRNKEILDNIIYLGMRAKCDLIIHERKKQNEKSL